MTRGYVFSPVLFVLGLGAPSMYSISVLTERTAGVWPLPPLLLPPWASCGLAHYSKVDHAACRPWIGLAVWGVNSRLARRGIPGRETYDDGGS